VLGGLAVRNLGGLRRLLLIVTRASIRRACYGRVLRRTIGLVPTEGCSRRGGGSGARASGDSLPPMFVSDIAIFVLKGDVKL